MRLPDPITERDVRSLHQLLADAETLLRQTEVSLRRDTNLFETVYVEADREDLVVSDQGEIGRER